MVEGHGRGQDQDQPFGSGGEQPGVLEIEVDGGDEHAAGEEAGQDVADEDEQHGSDDVGQIGEHVSGDGGLGGGCFEGGDAHQDADGDESPEDDAGGEGGGGVGGRPLGDGVGSAAQA